MSELNIILMGPPAAGKGTQSELICERYAIAHISTGDMFRSAIQNKTPLGLEASEYIQKGELVPDSVTVGLVRERLKEQDCANGFLLDGFPRTIAQADELENILSSLGKKLSSVILLVADDDVLIERISNRRVCTKCGASYNLKTKPSQVEGVCDNCGSELILRPDDRAESFSVRLKDYHEKTLPLADYYRNKGLLKEVDALQDINDVFKDVEKIIASL